MCPITNLGTTSVTFTEPLVRTFGRLKLRRRHPIRNSPKRHRRFPEIAPILLIELGQLRSIYNN